jgi:putative membrane protein
MAEPKSETVEKPLKILILCVDRDDDIGVKGGVKTPVIGKEKVSDAATKLALNDPEEADANAMFEAVRTYSRLEDEEKEHEHQVAVISGSKVGGVQAENFPSYTCHPCIRWLC